MSTLAIASILEELRCMDGELFKAEICQRLFLWLKTQANESLETVFLKSPTEYAKVLEMYRSWPAEVGREELLTLEEKAGGAEELQSAWVAVSLHWVRLHKKADGNTHGKMSVKIKTPDPRDLLKNFFVSLCSKSWCVKGDLWSMDPVKQDFVFREVFRQSVGNSVHFLQESEVRSEDVVTGGSSRQERHLGKEDETTFKSSSKHETAVPEHGNPQSEPLLPEEIIKIHEKNNNETSLVQPPSADYTEKPKEEEEKKVEETSYAPKESVLLSPVTLTEKNDEDEDDIGPDDSVSQFFSSRSVRETPLPIPTFSSPTPPPKRYADAGTVMYSSAPRRVLVKPITLKLENPIQNNSEE